MNCSACQSRSRVARPSRSLGKLALGVERLTTLAGWMTLILSFTTCTIPGFLLLLGDWTKIPTWAVVASMVATAVVLLPLALRSVAAQPQTRAATTDPGIVVSN